jgi:hypothetical protein
MEDSFATRIAVEFQKLETSQKSKSTARRYFDLIDQTQDCMIEIEETIVNY